MKVKFLTLFIGIITLLWLIYFIQMLNSYEPFTNPYRPISRHIILKYETFMNNYGPDFILTKLRKWNIY
jgi:hypothetical protein